MNEKELRAAVQRLVLCELARTGQRCVPVMSSNRHVHLISQKRSQYKQHHHSTTSTDKSADKTDENISDFSDETICEAIEILHKENAEQLNGYKIYTSVNRDLQKTLPTPTISNTARDFIAFVTDNSVGKIIAYKSTIGQIRRCPASAAKP